MSDSILNAALVTRILKSKGLKKGWVVQQIGLSRDVGYTMLRDGVLPKDCAVRSEALKKLAQIVGVEVGELLLRLDDKAG